MVAGAPVPNRTRSSGGCKKNSARRSERLSISAIKSRPAGISRAVGEKVESIGPSPVGAANCSREIFEVFMGGFNLQQLMSQAKQQYETLQKKMQETVVEASSGGGTVSVKMDGRKQLLSLKIEPE